MDSAGNIAQATRTVLPRMIAALPTRTLETLAPFHAEGGHFPAQETLTALARHDSLRGPVSLRVRNAAELLAHESVALAVAAAHDEIARREGWRGFPHLYCGRASTGVFLSLLEHGYPSAVVLSARYPRNHSYVGLPYSSQDGTDSGVIIIDPTFQQIDETGSPVIAVRKSGTTWEYRPGWQGGIDLYPDAVLDRDRMRMLANVSRIGGCRHVEANPVVADIPSYLKAAFSQAISTSLSGRSVEILKKLTPW